MIKIHTGPLFLTLWVKLPVRLYKQKDICFATYLVYLTSVLKYQPLRVVTSVILERYLASREFRTTIEPLGDPLDPEFDPKWSSFISFNIYE